jgi:predicted nucleic acid-binding Zn ribbon protein
MRKVADMLGDSLGRPEVLRAARAQKVLRHWPEVVGDFLSSKSVPDRFERGTLWVAATGSSWAQELRMQKEEILAKLNGYAGEKLFDNMRVGTRPPRRDWTLPAEIE